MVIGKHQLYLWIIVWLVFNLNWQRISKIIQRLIEQYQQNTLERLSAHVRAHDMRMVEWSIWIHTCTSCWSMLSILATIWFRIKKRIFDFIRGPGHDGNVSVSPYGNMVDGLQIQFCFSFLIRTTGGSTHLNFPWVFQGTDAIIIYYWSSRDWTQIYWEDLRNTGFRSVTDSLLRMLHGADIHDCLPDKCHKFDASSLAREVAWAASCRASH